MVAAERQLRKRFRPLAVAGRTSAPGPDRVETQLEYGSDGSLLNVRGARDEAGLPILADKSANRPSSGPHCFHQNRWTQYFHHSLEVVGKNMEAHLRTDLLQRCHKEMYAAHP